MELYFKINNLSKEFIDDSCTKNYFNVHINHKTKESVDN